VACPRMSSASLGMTPGKRGIVQVITDLAAHHQVALPELRVDRAYVLRLLRTRMDDQCLVLSGRGNGDVLERIGAHTGDAVALLRTSEASGQALQDGLVALAAEAGVVHPKVTVNMDARVAHVRSALFSEHTLVDEAPLRTFLNALTAKNADLGLAGPVHDGQGVVMALQALASKHGIPFPKSRFLLFNALEKHQPLFSAAGLPIHTLVAFMEQVLAKPHGNARALQLLQGSYSLSSGQKAVDDVAQELGLQAPTLRFDAHAFLKPLEPYLLSMGVGSTDVLARHLAAVWERDPEGTELQEFQSAVHDQTVQAFAPKQAEKLGLPAINLKPDARIVLAQVWTANDTTLGSVQDFFSAPVVAFCQKLLDRGVPPAGLVSTLGAMASNGPRATLKSLAAQHHLTAPTITFDFQKLWPGLAARLAEHGIALNDSLKKFVQDCFKKDVSPLSLAQRMTSHQTASPEKVIEGLAQLHQVAAPVITQDRSLVIPALRRRVEAAHLRWTPAMLAHTKACMKQGGDSLAQWKGTLRALTETSQWYDAPTNALPWVLDLESARPVWTAACQSAGVEYSPALEAYLEKAVAQGQRPVDVTAALKTSTTSLQSALGLAEPPPPVIRTRLP
jgi:hypothetical protein